MSSKAILNIVNETLTFTNPFTLQRITLGLKGLTIHPYSIAGNENPDHDGHDHCKYYVKGFKSGSEERYPDRFFVKDVPTCCYVQDVEEHARRLCQLRVDINDAMVVLDRRFWAYLSTFHTFQVVTSSGVIKS